MLTENLYWWAQNLPEEEARALLTKAAEEHPHGFTDTRSIGCNWAKILRTQGFGGLPPYTRNYLAHEYLNRVDAPRKVPVH